MRVISQDSGFDVPYENSSLSLISANICGVECANIYCYNSSVDKAIKMAQYSTEEKAKKAMEELRYAYMCRSLLKMGQTPPDGIDEKLTMGLSGVFQFPAEEELE